MINEDAVKTGRLGCRSQRSSANDRFLFFFFSRNVRNTLVICDKDRFRHVEIACNEEI